MILRTGYIPRNNSIAELEMAFMAVYRAISAAENNFELNSTTITANTTLDDSHEAVHVSTGAVTITLPPAATYYTSETGSAKWYAISNDYTNASNITIQADGSELIGNANTLTVPPGGAPNIYTNGQKWILF